MSSSFVRDCSDFSSAASSNSNKTVIIIVNNDGGNVALDGNELQNLLASHGADSCTQVSVVQMGQGNNSTDSLTIPTSSIQGADASNFLSHGLMPLNFTLDGFPSIALDGATMGSGYAELPLDADALRRLERVLETEEAREFLGEPLLDIVNGQENLLEPFEQMMSESDETTTTNDSSPRIRRSSPKRRSQRQMDKAERDEVEKILAENQRMLQEEREYFRKVKEEEEDKEKREMETEDTDCDDEDNETISSIMEKQTKIINNTDSKGKKVNNKVTTGKGKKLTKVGKGNKLNTAAVSGKGEKVNVTSSDSKGKKLNTTPTASKGKKLDTIPKEVKEKKSTTALVKEKNNIDATKACLKSIKGKGNSCQIENSNIRVRGKGGIKIPIELESEIYDNVTKTKITSSKAEEVKLKMNEESSLSHSHDDNSNIVKELPMKRLSVKVEKLDVRGIGMALDEKCSDCEREDTVSTSIHLKQAELLDRLTPSVDTNQSGKSDVHRLKKFSVASVVSSPPEINLHSRFNQSSPPTMARKEGSLNCGNDRNVVIVSSSSSPTKIHTGSSLTNCIISNSEVTDKSRTCDNLSGEILSDNIAKPKTNSKILMTNKNFSDVDPVKSKLEPLSSQAVTSTTTITSPPRRKILVVTPTEAKSVVDISGRNLNVKKEISAVNVKKVPSVNSSKASEINVVECGGPKNGKGTLNNSIKEEKLKKSKISFEKQLNLGNFATKVQKNSLKNSERSFTPIKNPNNILQHTPSISKNLMNYKIPKSSTLQKNLEFKENSCPSKADSSPSLKNNISVRTPVINKDSFGKLSLGSTPLVIGVPSKIELNQVSPLKRDVVSKDSQINSSILQRKNNLNIIKLKSATNVSNINDNAKTYSLKEEQRDIFIYKPEMAANIEKLENKAMQAVRRSVRPIKKKKFADDIFYQGKGVSLPKAKGENQEEEEEDDDDEDDSDSDDDKDVPFKKLQVETIDSSSEDSGSDIVDDDPGRLWCICQKPHNNRFMICCDRCEDWFHGSCVGVSKSLGKEMEEQECEWICPNCKKAERATKGFTSPPQQKMLVTGNQQENSEVAKKKSKLGRETVPRVVMFEKSTGAVLMGSSAPVLTSIQDFLAANPNYQCVTPDMMKSVETDPATGIKRIPLEKLGIVPEKKVQRRSSSFQDIIDSANSNKSFRKDTNIRSTKFLDHSEVIKLEHESAKKLEKQSSKKSSKSKEEKSSKPKEEKGSRPKEEKSKSKDENKASSKKIGSVFYSKDKSFKEKKYSSDRADEISPTKKVMKETKKALKISEDIDRVVVKTDSIVKVRTSVQKMLYEALEKRMSEAKNEFADLSIDNLQNLCKEIEEQLYLVFNKDVGFKYKSRYRSLVFNIRDTKNGGLFRNILTGTIPPEKLACLTSEEMASKELIEWREKEEKKELEAIQKHELERLAMGNQYIMKSHKGEIMIDKDDLISKNKDTDSVINLAHDQPKPVLPLEAQDDESLSNHKNHIYDPNCKICANSELHAFALSRSKEESIKLEQSEMKNKKEADGKIKIEKRSHESSKHRKKDKEQHRDGKESSGSKPKQKDKSRHKDRHRSRRSSSSDEDRKERRRHRSDRDSNDERRKHHHKDHKSSHVGKRSKDRHRKRTHSEVSEDRKRKTSESSINIRERLEENSCDNSSQRSKKDYRPSLNTEHSRSKSPIVKIETELGSTILPMESKVSTSDDIVFISQDSLDSSINDIKDVEPTSTVIGTPVNDGCGERTSVSPLEFVHNPDDSESEKIISEDVETLIPGSTSYSPDISPSNTPPLPNEPEIEEIFSPATPPLPDDVDEERLTPPPISMKLQKVQRSFQPPVWKGIINMIDVAKFAVACFEVSGKPMFVKGELHPIIEVVGRISPDTVWSYIAQQKKSGSKEILVVRFQPSNEDEKAAYISFYSYLSNKRRYGVIGNSGKTIKDFYIIPLASHQPIPQVLLPLDGPGFEESRPHMLIGVLVRVKRRKVYDPVAGSWITNEASKPRTYSFDIEEKDSVVDTEDSIDDQSYTPPPSFGYEEKSNQLPKEETLEAESFSPPSEDNQNLNEEENSSKEDVEEQYKLDRELLLAELNRTIERDRRELSEMQKKAELKMEERDRELEEEANNSDSHPQAENLALDTSKISIPSNLLEILNSIKQKEEAIKEKENEIKRRLNMVDDDHRDVFSGSKDVDLRLLLPQRPDELIGAGGQDQDMRLLTNTTRIPTVVENQDRFIRDPRIAKELERRPKDEIEIPSLRSMSDADLLAKAMEMEGPSMENEHLPAPNLIMPSTSMIHPLIPPSLLPPHPMMNVHKGGITPPMFGPIDNPITHVYGPDQPPPHPPPMAVHLADAPSQRFEYNRASHHNMPPSQQQDPFRDYMQYPATPDGDMRQIRDFRGDMDHKRNHNEQRWPPRERRGPEEWEQRYDGGWDSGRRPDFPHPPDRFPQSRRPDWFSPNDNYGPNRKRRFPDGRRPPLSWRNDNKRTRRDQGW